MAKRLDKCSLMGPLSGNWLPLLFLDKSWRPPLYPHAVDATTASKIAKFLRKFKLGPVKFAAHVEVPTMTVHRGFGGLKIN